MLNVLADVASEGETIVAVWVWGPGVIANLLSNSPLSTGVDAVLGQQSGPPGPSAQATSLVENAVQGATGLDGAEPATAFASASSAYIGMTLTVNSDGDGVPYNNLLSPIASLGGFFTPGTGPILSFVDYGNAGESSAPLAQLAASKDDAGSYGGGLVPKSAIVGIQDAIDSLGAETPYFQGTWGVGAGGTAVGASGKPSATGGSTGGFGALIQSQAPVNQAVGATANAAQKTAQAVKDTATGASIGIVGILIALIVAEAFLSRGAKA